MKKTKTIRVIMPGRQRTFIEKVAKLRGFNSISEYARYMILNQGILKNKIENLYETIKNVNE